MTPDTDQLLLVIRELRTEMREDRREVLDAVSKVTTQLTLLNSRTSKAETAIAVIAAKAETRTAKATPWIAISGLAAAVAEGIRHMLTR